jgi:hypothetical protein
MHLQEACMSIPVVKVEIFLKTFFPKMADPEEEEIAAFIEKLL